MSTDKDASQILDQEIQRNNVEGLAYAPYGFETRLNTLLGFNGEAKITLLGGYFLGNGYRLFSPALMRFCSIDNLSPFSVGGINTYAYCGGDPVNLSDPTGHMNYQRPNGATQFPGIHKFLDSSRSRSRSRSPIARDTVSTESLSSNASSSGRHKTSIHLEAEEPKNSTLQPSTSKTSTTSDIQQKHHQKILIRVNETQKAQLITTIENFFSNEKNLQKATNLKHMKSTDIIQLMKANVNARHQGTPPSEAMRALEPNLRNVEIQDINQWLIFRIRKMKK